MKLSYFRLLSKTCFFTKRSEVHCIMAKFWLNFKSSVFFDRQNESNTTYKELSDQYNI